jgi:putative transposase
MVAAAIRTIFAQPDAHHVREQLDVIADMLGRQFPKLEIMLRLNKEIKRRTDVVGVVPKPEALLRLAGGGAGRGP